MKREQALRLEPYTAITVTSLKKGENLLENILLTSPKLQPRKVDKPIVLYGAGNLGKMAKGFFDHLNMPFLYVVDKNAAEYKTDEYWRGIRIIHPDDVNAADKRNTLLVVCIVTLPLIALRDELVAAGWQDIAFFYDVSEAYSDRYPISNGWFLNKLSKRDKELIRAVYSSLNDNISRMHYLQFLAWKRLRIELLFKDIEINVSNRFFIPEIVSVLNEHEVFVDCGAHKGSVTEKFSKIVNGIYKNIYAIEPDKVNLDLCKSTLKGMKNTKAIGYALSDRNGKGDFYQGFDYASKLSAAGKDNVKTITLDSLDIPVTFIKMHLEGGELDALKGAVHTIQKYRPIVTVTTYHNSDGLWRIPHFFIDNVRDYLFYMRLHSWGGTGAVFYAIPKERRERGGMTGNNKHMKAQIKSKLNLDKHVPLQDYIPLQTPFLLYLDPSSACNFRCLFCPSGHKDAIKKSGYRRTIMSLDLFEKIIRDLGEFERPIKVLRMNKIGEPFLNKNLPRMVSCAKKSGLVEYIDLATNGSLFTHENLSQLFEAGLDRLNISVEGLNREHYAKYAGFDIDFARFVENVQWLYANKGNCEVTIKIPGNYLTEDQKKEFFDVFGNYCDRIFIEDVAPIWPLFDIEAHSGIKIAEAEGQYKQALQKKDICSYIFYSAAVNADGTVSACCPDWEQKLIIGDVRLESLKSIWHSSKMNALRRQHLEGRRCDNTICGNCGHLNYCQVDNIDSYRDTLLEKFRSYEKECLQ